MGTHFFLIVNSRISNSKKEELQKVLQEKFSLNEYTIHFTEYAGHAVGLAQLALQLENVTVVAVGGDGTVNEIIQVLANTSTPFAIIPMGSGNGLARHCHIPVDIGPAVELLKNGKLTAIDLGKANEKFFISNVGVGFDAFVCESIRHTKSRGLKMYFLHVLKHYLSYQNDIYEIESAEYHQSQSAFMLNVANGKEFGYGFKIAPNASLQDGYFDVVLVKKMNIFQSIPFVIDGWKSRLHLNKNCIYFKTQKIKIKGKKLYYFQTDGDAHCCDGICEIKLCQNALQLIVPDTIKNL
ncbi:MAG: diacylglycerol kinase family lipid kinase [Chitinophagaceae bacterium]|nr:MAG: diacylglycerol kinase catalytic subunit [Bacteroidetes bacterium OLB11]MCC6447851.1 diacylglycerol kinase family lipid kinase [Chitinophagaceae bacterium]HMN32502.1 diacylglycerol kinase family lipid kinase [Chitinophagaceae bacterium]